MANTTIMGYLGQDPKLETKVDHGTGEEKVWVRLRIGELGPKDRDTSWFWVTAFGDRARFVMDAFQKRDPIAVDCWIKVDRYQRKGEKYPREEVKFYANNFLPPKKRDRPEQPQDFDPKAPESGGWQEGPPPDLYDGEEASGGNQPKGNFGYPAD